jgi:hypothetical protein
MNGSAQSDEDLVVVGRNGLILSAALPPKKNLVVNVDGDGTVDISPDGSPYPHLAQVTLTAVAGPDFAFSFWSGDVSDDTNPLIIDMDSDKTITAHFVLSLTGYELWRYLEFTQEERADDEVSGPDADPDEDGLTNNDEFLLGTKPKEFNAPGNLVINIEGEGAVNISPEGGGPYPFMSEVTLTAVDTPEFGFSSWSGDASGSNNPLVLTMDSDKTVTANFVLTLTGYELWRYLEFTQEERADDEVSGPEADPDEDGLTNNDEFLLGTGPKEFNAPKNLVINIEGDGSVAISPEGGGPYPLMSEVILTAVGTSEFGFSSWSGDASGSNNPVMLTMDSDKTVTANFVLTLIGFPLWRYGLFNAEERADESLSGAQADFDGDGLSNLEEYLRGTNPKEPNFEDGLEPYIDEVEGEFYLFVPYLRDTGVGGVEQRVEVGDNLVDWLSGPTYSEIFDVVDNGDGTETVIVRILDPLGSKDRWFSRLLLEEPD